MLTNAQGARSPGRARALRWTRRSRALVGGLAVSFVLALVPAASASVASRAVRHRSRRARSSLCASIASLDRLVVRRGDAFARNHIAFSFSKVVVVKDEQSVRAVAKALCALPTFPKGAFSCPVDLGITYRLLFRSARDRFNVVVLNATGCEDVRGLGPVRSIGHLWPVLGRAIGLARPTYQTFRGRFPGPRSA